MLIDESGDSDEDRKYYHVRVAIFTDDVPKVTKCHLDTRSDMCQKNDTTSEIKEQNKRENEAEQEDFEENSETKKMKRKKAKMQKRIETSARKKFWWPDRNVLVTR